MSLATHSLKPLEFPLKGSALIEASAGTGKTFTLALLYVRLVLQQGGDLAFNQPLLPPSILVVTFTRAATKELRDRIRQRLVETATVLRAADPKKVTQEQLLLDLRQALIDEGQAAGKSSEKALASAAYKLEFAAQWMDEAAISTIHGWCYRMLKEHAFDSGNLFQQELIESEVELQQQAAEDYWRNFYLPLPQPKLEQVLEFFTSPSDTRKQVSRLLDSLHLLDPPQNKPTDLIAQAEREKQDFLKPLKEKWQNNLLPTLEAVFAEAKKKKAYAAKKLNAAHINGILNKLLAWAENEADHPGIDYASSSFQRLALLDTSIWTNTDAIPWGNAGSEALAALPQQLESLPTPFSDLLSHAAHWIGQQLQLTKKQQSLISNQDLLNRLDQALQSERGEQLADSIRKQFPVALVDEFQDTDPVQYRIFNRIYAVQNPKENTAFFMIGDPKQAIYAFRGADIYTYLAAKKDTGGRHYTLDRNFRSAPELIQAVNDLFALGEKQSRGAFLFKENENNPIPFIEVKPGETKPGRTTNLWLEVQGEKVTSMQSWIVPKNDDGKLNKDSYEEQISEITATQITRLLIAAQQDQAWLIKKKSDDEQECRSLQAADIAILVNNGKEAAAVRDALMKKGVASVYLSDRNSVYKSEAANALLQLLQAIAEPYNDILVRSALALPQLGLSFKELDELNNDELAWEERVQQFVGYHSYWQSKGSLALIHQLIKDFAIAERLLQQAGGERQVTDFLHLAELLQKTSIELDGEQALIRHLQEQKENPDENSEAQQVRLESDSELVQVVTIHKSKGLEYPLVFLPFATSCRLTQSTDIPLKTHNEQGELQLHLRSTPEILVQADAERLAEDLRKLYVALTRASYCQWLGLGEILNHHQSALGYLLGVSEEQPLAEAARAAGLSIKEPLESEEVFKPAPIKDLKKIRTPQTGNLTNWWIASYSAIHFQTEAQPVGEAQESQGAIQDQDTDTAREDQLEEENRTAAGSTTGEQPEARQKTDAHQGPISAANVLHRFPAGATWGTVLHSLLEWAAVQEYIDPQGQKIKGFAAVVDSNTAGKSDLYAFCHRRRIKKEFVEPLWGWLINFLHTSWPVGFALSDLKPSQIAVEMEFMLESHWVNAASLDRTVRAQTLNQVERPVAKTNLLNGLLKGFIDLVAVHEGRYYVIDWKSNRLGQQDEDYTQEAMQKQILSHRYDLQYVLYLVALHRQLKARLPDYDYDQHIGGAIYVFLRGTHNEQSQGLFCDKPPKALIEELDALFKKTQGEKEGATV